MGTAADHLVRLLTVSAAFDGLHQQIFRGDEGEVFPNGLANDRLIYNKSVGHIPAKTQDRIGAEESLRHGDAAVGGVIQRAFQPLYGRRHGGVYGVRDQKAGQRTDSLTAHGVSLIRHGGGANLVFFKGLLYLPVMLQQANIVCHPIGTLRNRRQTIQDAAVHLSGICLPADIKTRCKSEFRADLPVHLVDLFGITIE